LPKGNNQTILLVDDVAEQREIATGFLRNIGYEAYAMSSR
jgi:CheY-like chemotaxis protein